MSLGSAKTTLFKLGIRGIVGFTNEINNAEKAFFEGNSSESTLLLRTDATIAKVLNLVNKNAERLCRGKWQEGILNLSPEIICANADTVMPAAIPANDLAGKTLILRDQNLMLSDFQTLNSQPFHLFIDRGNLHLPVSTDTGAMASFDAFGYEDQTASPYPSKANFLKGNLIINGLLLGGDDGKQKIKNKLYMHGKLVSFNTFKQPTQEREMLIERVLGGKWDEVFVTFIPFDHLFAWTCNLDKGSDGTRCKGVSKAEVEAQGKAGSLLVDKAFGLIDMDFSSELFR